MNKQVGISLGSLLPWSAFPLNDLIARFCALPIAAVMTKKIGAEFWQVLPFKGVDRLGLTATGIEVRFVEDAWNATTFWRHLAGQFGKSDLPTLWQDVVLFPRPRTCLKRGTEILIEFPQAQWIDHELPRSHAQWNFLVEIHPDLEMSAKDLTLTATAVLATNRPYVLDTKHLRRARRDGSESPLWPWPEALKALLDHTALIHFQPLNGEELWRTLNGETTDLLTILRYLNGKYEGPFVIEIPPNILGPSYFANPHRMIQTLSAVRKLIEETAL